MLHFLFISILKFSNKIKKKDQIVVITFKQNYLLNFLVSNIWEKYSDKEYYTLLYLF